MASGCRGFPARDETGTESGAGERERFRPALRRRSLLTLAGVGLAAPFVWSRRADAAEQLFVRTPGGAYDRIRRTTIYEPFRKATGIQVVTVAATVGKLLAMFKAGGAQLDVIDTGNDPLYQLEKFNVLAPIPYDEFKFTDPANIEPAYKEKYQVGNFVYSSVLGYNTTVIPKGKEPQNWAEFWDLKKFPGPRELAGMASGDPSLEFALIADGVPMDKLYPLDIPRAFRSLSRVRPAVKKFWDTGALSAELLVDKEVVMGALWHTRLYAAIAGGAPLAAQWNQNMIQVQAFGIVKGARHMDAAVKYLDYCVSAPVQARFCPPYNVGPINKKAFGMLPADFVDNAPGGPKLGPLGFLLDARWWADNRPQVTEYWNKWILG
ncbi:MAG: ABC transporter substrate-binding protein [Stellaceae bacterium]